MYIDMLRARVLYNCDRIPRRLQEALNLMHVWLSLSNVAVESMNQCEDGDNVSYANTQWHGLSCPHITLCPQSNNSDKLNFVLSSEGRGQLYRVKDELWFVLLNSDPCCTILVSHAKRRQCHRHADSQQAAYPWVANNGPSLPWCQTFAFIFQILTEASHCQQ